MPTILNPYTGNLQLINSSSSGGGGNIPIPPDFKTYFFFDDFLISDASYALARWRSLTVNGGDINYPSAPDLGHPGVVQITTSTTNNGASFLSLGKNNSTTANNIILGGGVIDLYFVVKLPNLSDSTDTYQISVGLGDSFNTPSTDFTNGVYFNYSSTINIGQWQGASSSSSTISIVDSSIAVTTDWTTLHININAAASTITYEVNGTSIGTISTNIPTTTISPMLCLAKSAGTTARNLNVDMFYLSQTLTNARS